MPPEHCAAFWEIALWTLWRPFQNNRYGSRLWFSSYNAQPNAMIAGMHSMKPTTRLITAMPIACPNDQNPE